MSYLRTLSSFSLLGLLVGCAQRPPTIGACQSLTCEVGWRCNPATGQCQSDDADGGDERCFGDADCAAPLGRCLASEQRCVSCLADVDCTTGVCDLASHGCRPLPDSCSTAQRLDVSTGSAHVDADTSHAGDDALLSCALPGARGNDVVYVFELSAPQRLTVVAAPKEGSALRPMVALRKVCTTANDELGCSFPTGTAAEARLSVDGLPAGTYFLWVDGENDTAGPFALDLTLEPVDTGESCSAPTPLELLNGQVEVTGDTHLRRDDLFSSCGGQGAADAVYAFEVPIARRVRLELSTTDPTFQPVLTLRGNPCADSGSANQLGCAKGSAAGPAKLEFARLEAGQYSVVVDGAVAGSAATYKLTVELLEPVPPPTNDTCAAAMVVALPPSGAGVVNLQGDTTAAGADTGTSCAGSGRDLVYELHLTTARKVVARVTPLLGSPLNPTVYLRSAGHCADDAVTAQIGCATSSMVGGPVTLVLPNVAPGTWYLWVDGQQASAGAFDLSLELSAPPPVPANDSCAGAELVDLTGPVTVNGSTLGASDDVDTCALPTGGYSPDVVYELNLTGASARSLAVDLQAKTAGFRPVVSLRSVSGCAAPGPDPVGYCGFTDSVLTDRVALTWPVLNPGHYFLWVEGDNYGQGDFTMRLVSSAAIAAPANDLACTAPMQSLTSAPLVGDTRGATNNLGGSCSFTSGSNGEYAPDVAYQVKLLTAGSLTVTVTPDATDGQLFRPLVYVRSACGSALPASQVQVGGCAVASSYGQAVTLTVPGLLANTPYYVWVDGAGLSSGRFTIRLQ